MKSIKLVFKQVMIRKENDIVSFRKKFDRELIAKAVLA